ncbi:MAG: zf-HC2 domain-containing protein [Candidatus Saccharibacteria bacterium]
MDCRQVDKLAFLYCDNEVQAHLRKEVEKHLGECPECRILIENTRLETEALRFKEDLPELSSDFKSRVLLSITGGKPTEEYIPRSLLTRMRYKYFTGGNLFVGSMAAAVLVLMVFIPGLISLQQVKNAPAPSRHQSIIADSSKAMKTPAVDQMADLKMSKQAAISESAPSDELQLFNTTPAVYGNSEQAVPGRGEGTGGSAYQVGSETVPVTQPSYLPAGYYLSNIESDQNNVLSMYYENGSGGSFVVKVSEVSESRVAKKESNPPALLGAPPIKTEDTEFRTMKTADATTNNEPSQVANNVTKGEKIYRVELSGNISQEELNKIAASIK